MKRLFQTNGWLYVADALFIPVWIFGGWLSEQMLAQPSVCSWARFCGQCVTCGGTHFANALLRLRVGEAFRYNPFLFALTVFLLLSFLLLHGWRLGKWAFAKRLLDRFYSIPSLIVWLCVMLAFFLVRNIPVFCAMARLLF